MALDNLAENLLTLTRLLRPKRQDDLTPQQFWLLRHLSRTGPLWIGELAGALGITTGSATVALKRLEKAGLVTRVRSNLDERKVQVALTEQGTLRIEAWRQNRVEQVAHLLEIFNPQEQQVLAGFIERLLQQAHSRGYEA